MSNVKVIRVSAIGGGGVGKTSLLKVLEFYTYLRAVQKSLREYAIYPQTTIRSILKKLDEALNSTNTDFIKSVLASAKSSLEHSSVSHPKVIEPLNIDIAYFQSIEGPAGRTLLSEAILFAFSDESGNWINIGISSSSGQSGLENVSRPFPQILSRKFGGIVDSTGSFEYHYNLLWLIDSQKDISSELNNTISKTQLENYLTLEAIISGMLMYMFHQLRQEDIFASDEELKIISKFNIIPILTYLDKIDDVVYQKKENELKSKKQIIAKLINEAINNAICNIRGIIEYMKYLSVNEMSSPSESISSLSIPQVFALYMAAIASGMDTSELQEKISRIPEMIYNEIHTSLKNLLTIKDNPNNDEIRKWISSKIEHNVKHLMDERYMNKNVVLEICEYAIKFLEALKNVEKVVYDPLPMVSPTLLQYLMKGKYIADIGNDTMQIGDIKGLIGELHGRNKTRYEILVEENPEYMKNYEESLESHNKFIKSYLESTKDFCDKTKVNDIVSGIRNPEKFIEQSYRTVEKVLDICLGRN